MPRAVENFENSTLIDKDTMSALQRHRGVADVSSFQPHVTPAKHRITERNFDLESSSSFSQTHQIAQKMLFHFFPVHTDIGVFNISHHLGPENLFDLVQRSHERITTKVPPDVIKEFFPEAARRLAGREKLVDKLISLAEQEVSARGMSSLKVTVRPAWSHEYEEHTGIVIDLGVKANAEERFSLWESVCEQMDQLQDSLPEEESRFLIDEVSLIVDQV